MNLASVPCASVFFKLFLLGQVEWHMSAVPPEAAVTAGNSRAGRVPE